MAPLGTLVWKTFDVNLTWIMIFSSAKSWAFLFLHCVYGPNCEKFRFLGHIYFAKRFLFFLQKNLMWSRLQGIKTRFEFSTFRFLKFCISMNPKMVSRSRYALHDLPKNPDVRTRTRTYGHRFLNVCHTKAPKGAIIKKFAPKALPVKLLGFLQIVEKDDLLKKSV